MSLQPPQWMKSTRGAPFAGIGSLEADILAVIWGKTEVTVRIVYETLRLERQIAYTTVMTVMNNLVKKELLRQDRSGSTYLYTPAFEGRKVVQIILESVVDRLLGGHREIALSILLGLDGDLSPEQGGELRSLLRERFAL